MLDEVPKSTKKLCKLMLKISKVKINGGVIDFDIFHIITLLSEVRVLLKVSIIFLGYLLLVQDVKFLTILIIYVLL